MKTREEIDQEFRMTPVNWIGEARYADGAEISQEFPYHANGVYAKEQEEQYEIECWLIERHEDCVWYSVDVSYFREED